MLKSRTSPEQEESQSAAFVIEQSSDQVRWLRWLCAWSGKERKAIEDLTDAGFFPLFAPVGSQIAYRTVGRSSGLFERRVRYA